MVDDFTRECLGPVVDTTLTESLSQTESLFAENHELFFNSIDPKPTSPRRLSTSE
jgi:hypothetical protein